jgi:hypothetical protein
MRERLAYLHLPKSAGTSIRSALSSFYDESVTAPWSFDWILLGNHPAAADVAQPILLGDGHELSAYRYTEGHWALPTLLNGFDAGDIACLLREPRARLLSHYTFWRSWTQAQHDAWGTYPAAACARQPLGAFLDDPTVAHQADNLVARLILGEHPRIPFDAHIDPADVGDLASEACARLDQLGHVDLIDRGADAHSAFDEWFGEPLSRPRLNVTDLEGGEPVDLDDLLDGATLRRLADRTAIDARIWSHVASRRGLTTTDADVVGDAAFAGSLGAIVRAHAVRSARPTIEEAARAAAISELDGLAAATGRRRLASPSAAVRRGAGAIRRRIARPAPEPPESGGG